MQYYAKTEEWRNWASICPDRPCPFEFTEAEIESHLHEAEGWNENADFWDRISNLVQRDGWTFLDTYDGSFELFVQLREIGLRELEGEERDKTEQDTRWADRSAKQEQDQES